jgi:ribosomal protein S12 methylthiotransferase
MRNHRERVVYLHSLGCNKNTVDSEVMLTLLRKAGYRITDNPEEATRIVVNTCAFIDEAKEESIDAILELAERRKNGAKLVVTGCLSQLYWKEIINGMPEADVIVGTGNLEYILDAVQIPEGKRDFPESRRSDSMYREYSLRAMFISTPGSAYLKISEGCSRTCSFCLIPQIRGKMRSRNPESILEEGNYLWEKGIHELVLTSQDTLSYGRDLHIENGLKTILNGLLRETGIEFIRLLYLRPSSELLKLTDLFNEARVVPYFDIPLQHVSATILRRMKRNGSVEEYKELIEVLREKIPGAVFRTTLMVGFPGETDEDFSSLLSFIEEIQFNHVGVFIFSPQKGTAAFSMNRKVPKKIAEERQRLLMQTQQRISRLLLERYIGKTFEVLVEERFHGQNLYMGRSYHFAPEVDGLFLLRSEKNITPGEMVYARVTGADDYDLHGERVNSL